MGPRRSLGLQGENWCYPFDYKSRHELLQEGSLYAEKGLKVPETSDQFLENCRALTVRDGSRVDFGGCVIPLASDSATNWASFEHVRRGDAAFRQGLERGFRSRRR